MQCISDVYWDWLGKDYDVVMPVEACLLCMFSIEDGEMCGLSVQVLREAKGPGWFKPIGSFVREALWFCRPSPEERRFAPGKCGQIALRALRAVRGTSAHFFFTLDEP